jgi:L-ascorbate metabolism protein UlaG (beta-lactamase superfamily)
MRFHIKLIAICLLTIVLLATGAVADDLKKTKISKVESIEHNLMNMYGSACFLLTSSTGTTVLTDPINMPQGFKADIVTVTHEHYDHYDFAFVDRMQNCRKSIFIPETFSLKDIKVKSIASSHSFLKINQKHPSNVIYIYAVDGIRIAHMGDIGQEKLNDEQLKDLKSIDILFMLFTDQPQFGVTIEKSFNIVNQMNPKIIIPTHLDEEGYSKLKNAYKQVEYYVGSWEVNSKNLDKLGGDSKVVILVPESGSMVEEWRKKI